MNKIIRFILNIITQFKSINKLTDYQIIKLNEYLLNDNNTDKISVLKLLKSYNVNLNDLHNRYLDIKKYQKIEAEILNSYKKYLELFNKNSFIYNDLIDNKKLNQYKKDLGSLFKDLNKCQHHKFIKIYDFYLFLNKIYSNNLNKKIDIINKSNFKDLKDFIINNNNLIVFKIDIDLLKVNQFKLNKYNYFKIIITYYDSKKIYFIMNKKDFLNIDFKYSYDFNNLISYLLDYQISYYNIFNDKKIKSNIFKYKNFIGFNKVLERTIKDNDLKVNHKYKYSNEYLTFNDLLNLNLNLKYLDLDLNKMIKQLDLDLISRDNPTDYNKVLNKIYNKINNIHLKLFNEYKIINQLNLNLTDLKKYQDFKTDINYYISFITDYNNNQFILNKTDYLKDIQTDLQLLNRVLNILDNCYQDIEYPDIYLKDKNYYDYSDKLNNHNSIFKNKQSEFKKIAYNESRNNFCTTE